MTPTPQDSGVNESIPWLTALGGVCLFVARKYLAKINPWKLAQMLAVSLNEPLMQKHFGPVHARLDEGDKRMERIEDSVVLTRRVVDHLPGANEAHEAVKIEDAAQKRWEAA